MVRSISCWRHHPFSRNTTAPSLNRLRRRRPHPEHAFNKPQHHRLFSADSDGSTSKESKMTGFSDLLPGQQSDPSAADEVCALCPTLTYQQRIIGFVSCFCFGYLLSFIGTLSLMSMTPEGIRNFAALYVIGNIIAICSTGFLVGPKNQCKRMFDKTRRWSAIFYLSMLVIVFGVALAGQNVFLVLFLLFIQVLAAIWYTLSYIPFGRKAAVGCCQNTLFKPCPATIAWMA